MRLNWVVQFSIVFLLSNFVLNGIAKGEDPVEDLECTAAFPVPAVQGTCYDNKERKIKEGYEKLEGECTKIILDYLAEICKQCLQEAEKLKETDPTFELKKPLKLRWNDNGSEHQCPS